MGLYFIFFLLLIVAVYKELSKRKSNIKLFRFFFFIFSFFLIFRYGQGTDYFNYELNFDYIDEDNYLIYKDIGFSFFVLILKQYGISYIVFNMIFSLILSITYYYLIKNNCKYPIFGLLVLYCLFYIPMISSAIRQSLTVGIFGAFMMPKLRNGNADKSYYILGVLCCFFHIASIVTLLMPILRKFDVYKHTFTILILCFLFSISLGNIINSIFAVYERGSGYLDEAESTSVVAFISRFLMLLPILFVRKHYLVKYKIDFQYSILYFLIYIATWNISFISGRLLYYLRLFYIPSWEHAFEANKINKKVLIFFILMLLSIMYFKEIDTAILQGGYVNCNVVSYPFISVFNMSDLALYRREL